MSFEEIIKKIRATLNITQEQFARDLNISYTTLIVGRMGAMFQADLQG